MFISLTILVPMFVIVLSVLIMKVFDFYCSIPYRRSNAEWNRQMELYDIEFENILKSKSTTK